MVRNAERRVALVDAAIEVLAREGARGLTFRAVDQEAAVPTGTASNYFPNRDVLLHQVAERVHVRLTPDPAAVVEALSAPRDHALVRRFMRELLDRMRRERTGYLAVLELRLEATRRPELRASLTRTMSVTLEENFRFHAEAGLPGDRAGFEVLYLAMTGLLLEHLTLPDVLADVEGLVDAMVDRL
ncbi:TetR/AcrR family transcriptional regulator [Saccharothrix violaceirubra]|uniref:DNA-binding transcriptional regulator YbjK n=1 Tax=Saccharothrix violaceirubra TaxID=413306 RepID=A0A7W7SYG0_9PSEU|nr:TetR family transcriptional regulator [Saccharothrix violaceirubra]MBB4962996.1 DNA-binding transcriptional regulator YbjK [Saccharothrix violaceirubra]